MKFGVSKILPNSLSKWLSPKVDANTARRRRHDELDSDDEQAQRNSSPIASVSDERYRGTHDSAAPPPNKRKKTFTDLLSRNTATNEMYIPTTAAAAAAASNSTSLIGDRSVNIASSTLIEDVPHSRPNINQFNRFLPLENGQHASLASSPNTFIDDSVRDTASNYPDEASSSQSRERPTNPFAINNESSVVNFSAHLQRAKSLFTNRSYISPRLKNYRLRNPRSALYRSTSSLCDNNSVSSNASSAMSSPFYNGQTTFGGASATARRMNSTLNQDQQVLHRPKVPTNLVTSRSTSSLNSIAGSGSASMSNTAKRILDVMSKYNTPLTEVRRISNALPSIAEASALSKRKSLLETELNLTANEMDKVNKRALNKPNTPYNRPFGRNPVESVPTAELHVPSMPELLQLKKFAANTVKIRDIASNSDSALNKPAAAAAGMSSSTTSLSSAAKGASNEFKFTKTISANRTDRDLDASNNNKSVQNSNFESISNNNNNANDANKRHKNKIRNNLTRRRTGRGADDDLMPEPLNLPNVPLMEAKESTQPFQLQNVSNQKTTGTLDNGIQIPFKFKSSNTNPPSIAKEKQTNGNNSDVNNKFDNSPFKSTLGQTNSFSSRKNTSCTVDSSFKLHHTMNNSKTTEEATTKPAAAATAATAVSPLTAATTIVAPTYRFTEPIVINQLPKSFGTSQPNNLGRRSDYSFSEPKYVTDKCIADLPKTDTSKSFNNFKFDSKPVNNKISSDSGIAETSLGSSQAVKSSSNVTSSSADNEFGKPVSSVSTVVGNDDSFKSLVAKQKQDKWSCNGCLVSVDASVIKCPCCGATKPGASAAAAASSSKPIQKEAAPAAPVDDIFKSIVAKQKQSKWECKDCMAQNEQAQNKCACCGGANPNATSNVNATSKTEPLKPAFSFGALPASSSAVNPPSSQPVDNVFKAIVEKQKGSSWECSACLNRNDASKSKCVCCEQSREVTKGATASAESVPPKSQFSFGSNPASAPKNTFSFGSNAATAANTNVTPSVASTFSFGNLAPKANAQSSFTFGNIKSDSTALASSSNEKTDDDKAKESSQKPISSAQFSFGNPTVLPSTVKTDTTTATTSAAAVATIPSLTAPIAADNVFKSIVEKQKASSWECSSCMTKNPNEKEKCACCDSPKPGATANDSAKKDFGFSTNQKFSFGAPASSTFSFGSQTAQNKPTFQFGSASSATTAAATPTAAATAVAASTTTSTTDIFGNFPMPKRRSITDKQCLELFRSAISKDVTDTGPPSLPSGTANKGITVLDNVLIKPAENGPNEMPKPLFGQTVAKSSDDDQVTKAKKRSNTELIDSSVTSKLPATTSSGMPFLFGQSQPTNINIFGAIASNPAAAASVATTKSALTAQNPSFSFGSNSQPTSAFPTTQSTFSSTPFSFGANSAVPAPAAVAPVTATVPAPSAFGSTPAANPPSQPIFGSNAFSSTSSSTSALPTLGGFAANPSFGSSAPAFGTPSPSNNEVQPQATASPASGIFQFGAGNNTSANTPLTSDSQTRVGGFNFSLNTAPTFNFTEQNTQPIIQSNVPFQFGSPSDTPSNLFSVQPTANTNPAIAQRRKIRPIRRVNRP